MSDMHVTFCNCLGAHEPHCILQLRLRIKEDVCRERDIVNVVPIDAQEEIDRRVEAQLDEWSRT